MIAWMVSLKKLPTMLQIVTTITFLLYRAYTFSVSLQARSSTKKWVYEKQKYILR